VVPILTNCALADLLPWRQVPTLPFELVCLPPSWYRPFNLQVVRYAIPVLVALGQARHYHAPSRNPVVRSIRQAARKRSLAILETMQPESGGFLEATPLTAFVVMSLSSIGLAEHAIVRKGVEFLLTSVRADGSWPMDTNLTVKDTAQAVTALRWDLSKRVPAPKDVPTNAPPPLEKADPSEKLHGSVEETALAIEALIALHDQQASPEDRVNSAMEKGIFWLTEAILEGRYDDPSPIGSYFAKLWYHERLCPRIIAVQTLDRAAKHLGLMLDGQTPTTHRQAATTR
jgi:squalene-hopene/tetraprenyl-beta-curcumene cyclase